MCGFESAHVKESEKCIYHYCPACGMNGPHAKTEAQKATMRANMRPEAGKPTPSPTPTGASTKEVKAEPPTPTPTPADPSPTPTPTPTPKRRGLFTSGYL